MSRVWSTRLTRNPFRIRGSARDTPPVGGGRGLGGRRSHGDLPREDGAGNPALPVRVAGAGLVVAVALVGVAPPADPVPWSTVIGWFATLLICALAGLSCRPHPATAEAG